MASALSDSILNGISKHLRNDNLVLFAGAGISHQAPCYDDDTSRLPLWRDLLKSVAEHVGYNPQDYGGNILDLFDTIEANVSRHALEEAVRSSIPADKFQPSELHFSIASINWRYVVTTNYDDLLARALHEQSPICEERTFDWLRRERSKQPKLIHLHGTLTQIHTLSGRDYENWHETHPRAYGFLAETFLQKTIIFSGYSFSDPYLKFGLLPFLRKATSNHMPRHYAFMWQITEEQKRVMEKNYNIEAIRVDNDADWLSYFRAIESIQPQHNHPIKQSTAGAGLTNGSGAVSTAADNSSTDDVIINGYKLYYFRNKKGLSVRELSKTVGISSHTLNDLEQIKITVKTGPQCFKRVNRSALREIEQALDAVGELEFGRTDDFYAYYILFYKVNKIERVGRRKPKHAIDTYSGTDRPDTKAVVFDFGGTLTISDPALSTWEKIWLSVGYSTKEAAEYHRRFSAQKISHQQWCDATARKLAERNFNRTHLQKVINSIAPIPGLKETFETLRAQETLIYIASGSIREIIVNIITPEIFALVSEAKSNEMFFNQISGTISRIGGHRFDFEGKADYIRHIADELNCPAYEILFVGNSLNDTWAAESGARTLFVNPKYINFMNDKICNDYIRPMTTLTQILPYVARQKQATES